MSTRKRKTGHPMIEPVKVLKTRDLMARAALQRGVPAPMRIPMTPPAVCEHCRILDHRKGFIVTLLAGNLLVLSFQGESGLLMVKLDRGPCFRCVALPAVGTETVPVFRLMARPTIMRRFSIFLALMALFTSDLPVGTGQGKIGQPVFEGLRVQSNRLIQSAPVFMMAYPALTAGGYTAMVTGPGFDITGNVFVAGQTFRRCRPASEFMALPALSHPFQIPVGPGKFARRDPLRPPRMQTGDSQNHEKGPKNPFFHANLRSRQGSNGRFMPLPEWLHLNKKGSEFRRTAIKTSRPRKR